MACARPQVCVVCACSAVRFPRHPAFQCGRGPPRPRRAARSLTSDVAWCVAAVLFCSVLEFGPVPTSPAVRGCIAKKTRARGPPRVSAALRAGNMYYYFTSVQPLACTLTRLLSRPDRALRFSEAHIRKCDEPAA